MPQAKGLNSVPPAPTIPTPTPPSGPTNAIQVNGPYPAGTGTFTGTAFAVVSSQGVLTLGNAAGGFGGIIQLADQQTPVPFLMILKTPPAIGRTGLVLKFPPDYPTPATVPVLHGDPTGTGDTDWQDIGILGSGVFDPAGAAATAQSNAVSISETYTDGQIASLGSPPNPSTGTGTINISNGGGGWIDSTVAISGNIISNLNDISNLVGLSASYFGATVNLVGCLNQLAADVKNILAVLQAGLTGPQTISGTLGGSVSLQNGVVQGWMTAT